MAMCSIGHSEESDESQVGINSFCMDFPWAMIAMMAGSFFFVLISRRRGGGLLSLLPPTLVSIFDAHHPIARSWDHGVS